jgi:hypothetical protein
VSYSAGEALILTRLQAISGSVWTSTNTARGNWTMLNSGKADHYAVLKMGAGTNDGFSLSVTLRSYITVIEVWQSYQADGTSYTNMLAYWEAILDMFDQYRKLGDGTGTVQDARCSRWDAIEEMWTQGGGPRWLKQNFYIDWQEENNVTYAE